MQYVKVDRKVFVMCMFVKTFRQLLSGSRCTKLNGGSFRRTTVRRWETCIGITGGSYRTVHVGTTAHWTSSTCLWQIHQQHAACRKSWSTSAASGKLSISPERYTLIRFAILWTLSFTFCLHLKWKLDVLGFIQTDLLGEFSYFFRLCLMERHHWNCQQSIDVAFT